MFLKDKEKKEKIEKRVNNGELEIGRYNDFRWCSHLDANSVNPCEGCTRALSVRCVQHAPLVPTTVNLALALCDKQVQRSETRIRSITKLAVTLFRSAVSLKKEFSARFLTKQSLSAQNYTSLYSSPISTPSALNEASEPQMAPHDATELTVANSTTALCGELYPGRPLVRPRILFKNNSYSEVFTDECSKYYRFHASHTPGLFTLQCVCNRPKILGVTVMRESESICTALSSLLSQFKILPDVVFYDNSCNFVRSTALRIPWIFENTYVFSDRFHYRSHKCCSLFDPDTFPQCDELVTSGADSLNRRWAASRNHIRYLSGRNLIPFLYSKTVFMNLGARVRKEIEKEDVEDCDIAAIFDRVVPCSWKRCVVRAVSEMKENSELDNDFTSMQKNHDRSIG